MPVFFCMLRAFNCVKTADQVCDIVCTFTVFNDLSRLIVCVLSSHCAVILLDTFSVDRKPLPYTLSNAKPAMVFSGFTNGTTEILLCFILWALITDAI